MYQYFGPMFNPLELKTVLLRQLYYPNNPQQRIIIIRVEGLQQIKRPLIMGSSKLKNTKETNMGV